MTRDPRHTETPSFGVPPQPSRIDDRELLEEIDLATEVMIAANQAEAPLSRERIDRLLHLR